MYISLAMGYVYETEFEIWVGFWAFYFFHIFYGQKTNKNLEFLYTVASAHKSEKTVNFGFTVIVR